MIMLYDDDGNGLSPEQVKMLSNTAEGRKKIGGYILKARVGMCAQEVMNYLGYELKLFPRAISPEEQQNVCNIIWYVLTSATQDQVFKWVDEVSQSDKTDPDLYRVHGNC